MKTIFSKFTFPKSPGGNIYEWKDADTKFAIPATGLFAIKIIASAKNAKQSTTNDDDDLRIALDGFSFGKYEKHVEMVQWKGFNTSSGWDGASLKGGTKTIYFFAELEQGQHKIQFFADRKPTIASLEVFAIQNNEFILADLKPLEKIESNKKGIPWLSFVFLGVHGKNISLNVDTKSAKEKENTDADNLKVIINGKILQNEKAKTAPKYKNFYFSGDIKSIGLLSIEDKDLSNPLAFENSLELWYDEEPKINSLKIKFFDNEEFLKELEPLVDLRKYVLSCLWFAVSCFYSSFQPYSAKFLIHATESNPKPLIFKSNHPIVKKIKSDPAYDKILKILNKRIKEGVLEGEIWPEGINGGIKFESYDLANSIHGIKKIEYQAKQKNNKTFEVKMVFFDIYDFEKTEPPFFLLHPLQFPKNKIINALDMGEDLNILNNFEIKIYINLKLTYGS